MIDTILNRISNEYPLTVKKNESLSGYTTMRTGGNAEYIVFSESAESLVALCGELDNNGVRYIVIGKGSNLLFPDEGFNGVVVCTEKIDFIKVNGKEISAGCGASLIKLSRAACDASLGGLEFAYGIPGTVGGAVYMNAGAYDGEVSMIVKSVSCYDTVEKKLLVLDNESCDFSYRNSIFEMGGNRYIITDAVFNLEHKDKNEISAQMNDYMTRRRDKQPLEYPSAGSAFKRAPGYFTAKLIDEAGLKGYTVGGAQVSEKHAGFIINRGNATSADVRAIIAHIQKTVLEKNGVELESEIRIITNN